ncbi:Formate dehydrogenase, nitrate-inducible, iron-sulfur subunit [compost metagenome]
MYVLQHADDPKRYAGLPKDPKISTVVSGWKDGLQPGAAVVGAAAVVGMAAHFMAVGPNTTEPDGHDAPNDGVA